MADQKLTEITNQVTTLDGDELLYIVDDPGGTPAMGYITSGDLRYNPLGDGWVSAGVTWTYASASTFTVSGDVTSVYRPGTRLKFTQTTVKYAVVASSSYGAPNTTVTIILSSDYTIANAAISANYFSHIQNPSGFPGWFNWTPTFTGFSSAPTNICRWFCVGNALTIAWAWVSGGTSNSADFKASLPVAAKTISGMYWAGTHRFVDNSASTSPGLAQIPSASTTVDLYVNHNGGGWQTSGNKYCITLDPLTYEF